MQAFFKLKNASSAVYICMVFLLLIMQSCSSHRSGSKSQSSSTQQLIAIPISLTLKNPNLNLADDGLDSLNLVSTGTELKVSISGCASGYTSSTVPINSGNVLLYKGDSHCLVKLESFKLGTTTYVTSGDNFVAFNTWAAGGYATFQSDVSTSSTDTIKVFVASQVTDGGVLVTDTVAYNFTDTTSTTTQSISGATVSTGVPLSATGLPAPNFTVKQARVLSTKSNGSLELSFTLECGINLTGSSVSTYTCDSTILQSQLDYILITDAYSQGTISVAQANKAFTDNTPTSMGSRIIPLGASDSYNNVLPKGGFYTSDSTPLVTGTSAIYPSNLNNVLMLRRKDAGSNTLSYLYFYVNITSISQNASVSAFGASYAGGAGTANNPYLVTTRSALAAISGAGSTVHFLQIKDIDLGGSATPWTTITLASQYNGGGHKLTGLYQNGSGNKGLFGTINSNASLSNLTLESVNLTATTATAAGAFAVTLNGSLTNCSASGTLTVSPTASGGSNVGGLVAVMNPGATISSSNSSVNIVFSSSATAVGGNFGGIVGGISNAFTGTANITDTSATGSITLTNTNPGNATGGTRTHLGGFVGDNEAGRTLAITKSYSTVNITITSGSYFGDGAWYTTIGGFIGNQNFVHTPDSSVTNSFSGGIITTTGANISLYVGGILGRVQLDAITISNSYSMSKIVASSATAAGGILGEYANGGTANISNSYVASPSISLGFGFVGSPNPASNITGSYLFDSATVPSDTSSGVTSYTTTTDMETQSNFSSFDFTTPVWKMPSANPLSPNNPSAPLLSPVLIWQCGRNGIVCP